jgi:hypothetical protein
VSWPDPPTLPIFVSAARRERRAVAAARTCVAALRAAFVLPARATGRGAGGRRAQEDDQPGEHQR